MRRAAGFLLALAAAAVWPAPADAAASCAMRGSSTQAAGERARVFLTTNARTEVQTLWGCLYRDGRRLRLARLGDREYLGAVRVSGRFVAFSSASGGTGAVAARLDVVDLRGRRRVFRWDAGPTSTLCALGRWGIADVVLKGNGSVAWLFDDDPGCNDVPGRFEVYRRLRSEGEAMVLESGDDIERDSLGRSATRVYWVRAGVARSAAFD